MKKSLSILSLLVLILTLSCSMNSCGLISFLFDKSYDGLEEFHGECSSVGICGHVPLEIIDKFQYVDGDFHYYSRLLIYEKMLLYLSYDEDEYQSARSYVMSERNIEDTDFFESCNTYEFYNTWDNNDYPSWYALIGFSDTYNTIVFLGLYTSEYDYISSYDISFLQHIDKHFGEWFDFE